MCLIQTPCQKSCEPKSALFRSVITTEANFIAFRCTDAKCIGLSQYAISTRRIITLGGSGRRWFATQDLVCQSDSSVISPQNPRKNLRRICVSPVLQVKTSTPAGVPTHQNTVKSLLGNRRPNVVLLVIDNKSSFLARTRPLNCHTYDTQKGFQFVQRHQLISNRRSRCRPVVSRHTVKFRCGIF